MNQYIDVTTSTALMGFIGLIAPFALPRLFKWIEQSAKRKLTSQEKRLLITSIAFFISLGAVAYYFEWNGSFMERAWAFIVYLGVNYATLRGVTQGVYEVIIGTLPELKRRLEQ